MEFISEGSFGKIFKNEDFGFDIFEKGQILKAFFRPSTLNTEKSFQNNLRVGYVYIDESFYTIFNMGCRGAYSAPPQGVWVGKIAHGREG